MNFPPLLRYPTSAPDKYTSALLQRSVEPSDSNSILRTLIVALASNRIWFHYTLKNETGNNVKLGEEGLAWQGITWRRNMPVSMCVRVFMEENI